METAQRRLHPKTKKHSTDKYPLRKLSNTNSLTSSLLSQVPRPQKMPGSVVEVSNHSIVQPRATLVSMLLAYSNQHHYLQQKFPVHVLSQTGQPKERELMRWCEQYDPLLFRENADILIFMRSCYLLSVVDLTFDDVKDRFSMVIDSLAATMELSQMELAHVIRKSILWWDEKSATKWAHPLLFVVQTTSRELTNLLLWVCGTVTCQFVLTYTTLVALTFNIPPQKVTPDVALPSRLLKLFLQK